MCVSSYLCVCVRMPLYMRRYCRGGTYQLTAYWTHSRARSSSAQTRRYANGCRRTLTYAAKRVLGALTGMLLVSADTQVSYVWLSAICVDTPRCVCLDVCWSMLTCAGVC